MAIRPGEILAKVVRTAQAGAAASDRALLARYVELGDQAAFAAVVRRHSAMVHGVCLRALHSQVDAEDACQAVFLILSTKAKAIRWNASAANWLYTTARKVAHNARRAQLRRARRERAAAKPESVPPADALSGRELMAALDEELDKLPARYREPLVLCYLEGLTRDEAAARLGVSDLTLKSQLERGRKKLAEALPRRGCTLGAALLATVAASAAGAATSRLVEPILAAVGGAPSPAVAALVKGSAMNGMLVRAKLVMLLAIGAAVVGGGGALLLAPAAKPQTTTLEASEAPPAQAATATAESKPETKEATPAAKQRMITVTVVGPDGKPIEAELHLVPVDGKPESLGKTATDGTFRLMSVPITQYGVHIVASAAGHAIDFARLEPDGPPSVKLKLAKDFVIRGRIVDPQGKPVAGAAVHLRTVNIYGEDSIQQFLDEWKKRTSFRDQPRLQNRHLYTKTRLPFGAATDRDGRFELPGVGAERLVSVQISGAGRAETDVHISTRQGFDPKPYVVEPEKLVRGRLTDAKTGLPRAGVEVAVGQVDESKSRHRLPAFTGADGKYEIHGARKQSTYQVTTKADPLLGYLPATVDVADTAGYEPATADIACPKGVIIKGTLRDKSNGQPIAGPIQVAVLADNPYLKKLPTVSPFFGDLMDTKAEPDGTYRVVILPGPMLLVGGTGKLGQHDHYKQARPDPKYPQYFSVRDQEGALEYHAPNSSFGLVLGNWCKVIDAKETDTELTQDIELVPGRSKGVQVVDSDGKPIKGFNATGINEIAYAQAEPLCDTDTITVWNLDPKQERLVAAIHHQRKLVGAMVVKEADRKPVLRLGPGGTAKARLVDMDGKPLAGVGVILEFDRREVAELYGPLDDNPTVETDANGEFQFDALLPGYEFCFFFIKGTKQFGPNGNEAPRYTIGKHGDTKNLGDLKVVPKAKRE